MQSDEVQLSLEENGRAVGRKNTEIKSSIQAEDYSVPLFYFSIRPWSYPDTLLKITDKPEKNRIKKFLNQGIRWEELQVYLHNEYNLLHQSDAIEGYSILERVTLNHTPADLLIQWESLPDSMTRNSDIQLLFTNIRDMEKSKNYFPLFIPSFHWHGLSNRYHQWLKKIFRGDWGNSRVDYRPSWLKIKEAISWTLAINTISLVLVFGLAIVLGEWLFLQNLKARGKLVEVVLFFIYSIPRFFLAMLLIQFFASDTIHPGLHIFPSPGFFDADPSAPFFSQWIRYGNQLILPVISVVLPSMAYLTRIYTNKLLDERAKPYAFMAWSKGDTPRLVTRQHLRRNAMMPLVALLGLEIPALIGGSVVIEVLFNLPGMGRLMLQSIVMQDWVIVFNILLLTGVFTIIGKLISDILYSLMDPRVSWSKS